MITQTHSASNAAWTYTLLAAVVMAAIAAAIIWAYAS
jgi:hypothetical protein